MATVEGEQLSFQVFKGMRVLVTGHTGFKGSWLSFWLSELGAHVQGYALEPETEPHLFGLAGLTQRVRHEVGDLRDLEHFQNVMVSFQPEIVFHLAAQAIVRRSYRDPKSTFDVNIGGTVNVLEAVRVTPSVRAVVVITSDKCYENREWVWGYRENDPLGGHDPYSSSKAAAELVVAAYRESFFRVASGGRLLGLASARAGNVIGGGDFAEDRILPDAIRAIQQGRELEVRNPSSVRPWQHVLDPLAGYLHLAKSLIEDPARYSSAWNFGPMLQAAVTVERLATRFFELLGQGSWRDVSVASQNAPHESHMLRLAADKAKIELGWSARFDIHEAIKHTAHWYRQVILENRSAVDACRVDIHDHMQAKVES